MISNGKQQINSTSYTCIAQIFPRIILLTVCQDNMLSCNMVVAGGGSEFKRSLNFRRIGEKSMELRLFITY